MVDSSVDDEMKKSFDDYWEKRKTFLTYGKHPLLDNKKIELRLAERIAASASLLKEDAASERFLGLLTLLSKRIVRVLAPSVAAGKTLDSPQSSPIIENSSHRFKPLEKASLFNDKLAAAEAVDRLAEKILAYAQKPGLESMRKGWALECFDIKSYDFSSPEEKREYLRAFPLNGKWRSAAQKLISEAKAKPSDTSSKQLAIVTDFIKLREKAEKPFVPEAPPVIGDGSPEALVKWYNENFGDPKKSIPSPVPEK
ncbi:hypothetical protein WDW86_00930 [Bdellovibrionota bacterium FG-2]